LDRLSARTNRAGEKGRNYLYLMKLSRFFPQGFGINDFVEMLWRCPFVSGQNMASY